eukprot:gene11996-5396_t
MFESDSLASIEDVELKVKSHTREVLTSFNFERTPVLLNKFFKPTSKVQPEVDINLLHPKGVFDTSKNPYAIFKASDSFTLTQIQVDGTEDQYFGLKEAVMFVSSEPILEEQMQNYILDYEKNIKTKEFQPTLILKLRNFKFKHKFKLNNFPHGKFIGFCFLKPEGHIEVSNIKLFGFEGIKNYVPEPFEESFAQNKFNTIYIEKQFMMELIKYYPTLFADTSFDLKHDKELIYEAVKYSPKILYYLSPNDKNDASIVKESMKYHISSIKYASYELKNDYNFLFNLIQNDGNIFSELVKYVPMMETNPLFFVEAYKFAPNLIEDSLISYDTLHKIGICIFEKNLKVEIAIKIFEFGVEHENKFTPEAHHFIGNIFFKSSIKDFQKAKYHYQKSFELGYKKSVEELNKINNFVNNLNKDEINILENCSNENDYIIEKMIYCSEERYVYRVKHKSTNKSYALKRFTIDIFDFNNALHEVVLLIQLKNELICELIDFFVQEDVENDQYLLSMIMPFYDQDLMKYITLNEMTEELIRKILIQLCHGIDFIHSKGYIHRDIKPQNVFLKFDDKNEIKEIHIGDFGLSCESSMNTMRKTKVGTKSNYLLFMFNLSDYFAPEIFMNTNGYDYRSDLFSLGSVLYTMMTKSEKPLYLSSIQNNVKKIEEEIPKKFSSDLVKIMSLLLNLDPSERISLKQVVFLLEGDIEKMRFDLWSPVRRKNEEMVQQKTIEELKEEDILRDLTQSDSILLKKIDLNEWNEYFPKNDTQKIKKKKNFHLFESDIEYFDFSSALKSPESEEEESVLHFKGTMTNGDDKWENEKRKILGLLSFPGNNIYKTSKKSFKYDYDIAKKAIIIDAKKNFEFLPKEIKKDKTFWSEILRENGQVLKFLSHEMQNDQKLVFEAVKNDINAIQFCSKELKNNANYMMKILSNSCSGLKYLPKNMKENQDLILKILCESNQPEMLKYVSPKLLENKKFVVKLININPHSLKYVSKFLQGDVEILKLCLDKDPLTLEIISTLNDIKVDRLLIESCVKENGMLLEFVPEKMKSEKSILLSAVKNNAMSLKFVPENLKDDLEIIQECLEQNINSFQFFSDSLKSDECFVEKILKQNGTMLKFVDESLKDDEALASIAIHQNACSLQFASDKIRNNVDFIQSIIYLNPIILSYTDLRDDFDFVKDLIKKNAEYYLYVSVRLQYNLELAREAVKSNGYSLVYISNEFQNDSSIVLLAAKENMDSIQYASISTKNNLDIGMKLVEINGKILKYLSSELQDNEEIVIKALENDPESWIYASDRIKSLGCSKKYSVIEKIAEGGEGIIFKVEHKGNYYVEKRMFINDINEINLLFQNFQQLKECMGHENIYEIIEVIQDTNNVTNMCMMKLIMKLYDGDLSSLKETLKMDEDFILKVGIEITKGIHFLHSKGIIHCDLKPQNIFYIQEDNNMKFVIADFGSNRNNDKIFGSLLYVAPEIVDNMKHTIKSDIFGIGGVLYNLMYDKEDFLYLKSIKGEVKIDNELYSNELNQLILNLLNVDPEVRKSTEEILLELKKIKEK